MKSTKLKWLTEYRKIGYKIVEEALKKSNDKKKQTEYINKEIKNYRDKTIERLLLIGRQEKWNNEDLLKEILLDTYASYISMLESRNKVWKYEYMAFARRIGELWEPFCKLPFSYPIIPLKIIDPPNFDNVQNKLKLDVNKYIDSLDLSDDIKKELKIYYNIPWIMVDSGGIKLGLDLHFEQNGIHYNCDFKSGFSSNEKGNTNRLLLVASIYNLLSTKDNIEKTIIFVRQPEDENNHYLQTLKDSPYWGVYCADDCYDVIKGFTGFNLRKWLDENVDWENDIEDSFKQHLESNNLLKYLTW